MLVDAVEDLVGGECQPAGVPDGGGFVPGERCGHGGPVASAQRVGRDGGFGRVVLRPVDEDTVVALGLAITAVTVSGVSRASFWASFLA